MVELYHMDENGITLVDTLTYGEWMAFVASSNDTYTVDNSAYAESSLTAVVA